MSTPFNATLIQSSIVVLQEPHAGHALSYLKEILKV
jgi:hypothetical protein